jgi:hypothetical protein
VGKTKKPAARTARKRKAPAPGGRGRAKRCKHTGRAVAILGVDVEAYACRKCDAVGVRPVGRANDSAPEVEMRAAELERASIEAWWGSCPGIATTAEDWGWTDHLNGAIAEPLDGEPADSQWHAGWLAREIATQDVRESRDADAWAWDTSRPLAEQLAETADADALAVEPWSCPAESNECAIRRQCTNKCGRNDPARGHVNAALATVGPLMSAEEAEQVYDRIGKRSAIAGDPSGLIDRVDALDVVLTEALAPPADLDAMEYELTRDAEPDCRDEDGPEVERIMAEMERSNG